jgi:hypothetical protein
MNAANGFGHGRFAPPVHYDPEFALRPIRGIASGGFLHDPRQQNHDENAPIGNIEAIFILR